MPVWVMERLIPHLTLTCEALRGAGLGAGMLTKVGALAGGTLECCLGVSLAGGVGCIWLSGVEAAG